MSKTNRRKEKAQALDQTAEFNAVNEGEVAEAEELERDEAKQLAMNTLYDSEPEPRMKPVQVGQPKPEKKAKKAKREQGKVAQPKAAKPVQAKPARQADKPQQAKPAQQPEQPRQEKCLLTQEDIAEAVAVAMKDHANPQIPDWAVKNLQALSGVSERLTEIAGEHERILTDHEWRIHDLEKHVGLEPKSEKPPVDEPEVKPEPQPEPKPTEPEPKPTEPTEPEPKPTESEAKSEELEPLPKPTMFKEMVPAKMYEYWDHRVQGWCGPVAEISAAKQAAGGLLSGVRIVHVWFDPEKRIVLGYMSGEDILQYMPM